ncbi:MAG: hypothetical protein SGI77_27655 [Pirellulaceae bacterium]|nr:hypothetical protein [Pirellulaceae bacterium]
MKLLLALVSMFALNNIAFSRNIEFPSKEEPLFNISIPADWDLERGDYELDATSPDENAYVSVWELDSSDAADEIEKTIVSHLKDHAKKIKLDGKPVQVHAGGMNGVLYTFDAIDKADGHTIVVLAVLITANNRASLVLAEINADDAEESETDAVNEILGSIGPSKAKKPFHAKLTSDKSAKSSTSFTADTPKIYVQFTGETLEVGDKLRAVFVAEKIGGDAPKLIDEASVTATSATCQGSFTLINKTEFWPVGTYRVKLFVNDKLTDTLPYTIESE